MCRQYGLLTAQIVCPICNRHYRKKALYRAVDGVTWRCPVNVYKRELVSGTVPFQKNRTCTFGAKALESQGEWPWKTPSINCKSVASIPQLTGTNIVGTQSFPISEIRRRHHKRAFFSRRKYNRVSIVPEQLIFGGYNPATKEGFLLRIPRRSAVILMPLIIQRVRQRTEIWSDMWDA